MAGVRFADLAKNPVEVLDFTSLTLEEFQLLVAPFECAFQAHMANWRLDGKPRTARGYTTYQTCPLPAPEDRLLFILSYLKSNSLQVFHGRLVGMRQTKANQWIHTLLPVVRATFARLGDLPSRSLEELAQRLSMPVATFQETVADVTFDPEPAPAHPAAADDLPAQPPLFAMTAPNDPSHAPKMRLNRKAAIAARKSGTR